jgi:uroporphyrinogen-III decarboxylase
MEREFFRRIRSICDRSDALSLLHICGDNTAVFEDYATCGADIVAIDHMRRFVRRPPMPVAKPLLH